MLYSARMEKRHNMTEHTNQIKAFSQLLEAIDDIISEKDLTIVLISSLLEEYNYLIIILEKMAEDHLNWNDIRDRLIHEREKKKSCENEKPNDALFVAKPDQKSVKFHCCKSGHYARDGYKKEKKN